MNNSDGNGINEENKCCSILDPKKNKSILKKTWSFATLDFVNNADRTVS